MSELFQFSKSQWQVLKDKKVFETPIFSLHQVNLASAGKPAGHPFYVLNAPEWINVMAITPERKIVLVEQYRAGTRETTLEIPGGMVDEGESPEEAAQRELLEETGYYSDSWELLGKTSSNPAILSNYTHLYLANNCIPVADQNTDQTEDIRVHTFSLSTFLTLVKNGIIHHAIVLAAVSQYLLRQGFDRNDL